MRSNAPEALLISAILHAAVVGLVLFFSYAASRVVQENPKVFELVAGGGDNYAATAAPALGSQGGVKVPAQRPQPKPPAPKPQPAPIQAAPEAVPAKAPKPVDLVAQLKRVEAQRERRLEARYRKEEEAERKRQEELQREHAAKVAHIDAEGIKEGVLGGSTENKTGGAGGRALTREEGSELEAYFALLKARIKENHVPPEGVSSSLEARVACFVAADGSLSHVRILRSSGNADFDRSVVDACEHARPIGARPDGQGDTVEMTFKMHEDEGP